MLSPVATEINRVLLAHENGLSDSQVREILNNRYAYGLEEYAHAINELLAAHRVKLFTHGSSLVYRAVNEEAAAKIEGLEPEHFLVLQIIEKSGSSGIWSRDIKIASSLPQNTLTKSLKTLELRSLVKCVRSVVSKSKKLYVLFDVVPAKSVTGGPWYSDQAFDHEFVSELGNFIVQIVHIERMLDLPAIAERVRVSGISKIELSEEELGQVLDTLVYDWRLQEIQSSVLLMSGYATGKKVYKVSKMRDTPDHLTSAPCGVCPVRNQCCEGGVISPVSCPYIAEWLGDCAGSTGGGSTGSTVSWEEGEGEMEGAAGGVGAEDRKKKKGRSTDLTW